MQKHSSTRFSLPDVNDQTSAPVAAILVAAGSGSRLGHPIPKALVELAGTPIVVRAVQPLLAGGAGHVVVVAPSTHLAEFHGLLADRPNVTVVEGGAERQDSVRLGLDVIADAEIVLVHDAARPLVPRAVVESVIAALRDGARAVVPVVPVVDSIRRIDGKSSVTVDRAELRAVQTPQGFDASLLKTAHTHAAVQGLVVTDDAGVCEAVGEHITFVDGHREAMKITEPFDLAVAEAILAAKE